MINIAIHTFSYFENLFSEASRDVDLMDLKKMITSKSNELYKMVKAIRETDERQEAEKIKKRLPGVTISSLIKGTRKSDNIAKHSNLLAIDIDDLDNVQDKKHELKNDPFVLCMYTTVSDKGLRLIFQIDGDRHKDLFNTIREYLLVRYEIVVDEKCKDEARLMFLSHDPDFYLNPDAKRFEAPRKATTFSRFEGHQSDNTKEDFIAVVEEIELQRTDITTGYDAWLEIGFVCADLFGEVGRDYFHRISQFHPDYQRADCDKQFDCCLKHKGKGITAKTFFHLAKQNNINISAGQLRHKKTLAGSAVGQTPERLKILEDKYIFWCTKETKNGFQIAIKYLELNNLILMLGFRRFDIGLNKVFVLIKENVVKEVSVHHIQDAVLTFIRQLPDDLGEGVYRNELLEKFYRNPAHYFNDKRLNLLSKDEEYVFNEDTPNSSFVYYRNGYIKVNKDGYDLYSYSTLTKLIWRRQIINRDFSYFRPSYDLAEGMGMFAQFLLNFCGGDMQRFYGFRTIIGYMLHIYFETKLKCVILTDSKISDLPEGRTGKTLIAKAVGQIRSYTEVDGKNFDPTNRFKWQDLGLDTQFVCLNDLQPNFNLDHLFTAISEGIKSERKNQQPIHVNAKLLLTTNRTVVTDGDSRKDRCIEFEASDHYSASLSPSDEFKCWFFKEWDNDEWSLFDCFMVNCLQAYFKSGLVIPAPINLEERKLLEFTNADFVEFMNDKFKTGVLGFNKEYDKKEIHNLFLGEYPDYVGDKRLGKQRQFTKYLHTYCKYSKYVEPLMPSKDERKSGATYYITFRAKEIN